MKFLICSLILQFLPLLTTGQECDGGGMRKFDSDVARLVSLGNSGRRFPEQKGQELNLFCDESFDLIASIGNYRNKCLKNLPRQVTGLLIYAVKNSMKQFCKESKRQTELLSATSCVNNAHLEFTRCYGIVIDAIQGAKLAKESRRIPHMCCEYFKIYPCLSERTQRFEICSTKRVEILSNFIRSIFDNMVDLICGDYTEHSDKCEKLEPAPKKRKNQKRTKSFAIPLIELLDSFPEVH